jgi:uncharacterized membrane protein YkvA (DUF1232 family)
LQPIRAIGVKVLVDVSTQIPKRPVWATVGPLIFALLYDASPVDLIPDLFPILGWLDDGVVTVLMLAFAVASWRKWAKSRKALARNRLT